MKIVNLTQHEFTADQLSSITEMECDRDTIKRLITFDSLDDIEEMTDRADSLASIAVNSGAEYAMIGGAPFFMSVLEQALIKRSVKPVYAFSKRDVVETTREDGSVEKKAVFKHEGWLMR